MSTAANSEPLTALASEVEVRVDDLTGGLPILSFALVDGTTFAVRLTDNACKVIVTALSAARACSDVTGWGKE